MIVDRHLAHTLTTLNEKREGLVATHEERIRKLNAAHAESLRELDGLIAGIKRFAESSGEAATESSASGVATQPKSRRSTKASPRKTRAPRGKVQRRMLEAVHGQPGRFSIVELQIFSTERYPNDPLDLKRISNEANKMAKKDWIKCVGHEGKRNLYEKTSKLPPLK